MKRGDRVRLNAQGRAALKYEEIGSVPWCLRLKDEAVMSVLVPDDAIGEVEGQRSRDASGHHVCVHWPSGWVGLHEPSELELVSPDNASKDEA